MLPALFLFASLVTDVRGLIAQHDFAGAERTVGAHRDRTGATSELAAALSWLARGALDAKRFNQAESYAAETRKLALELLGTRQLDGDRWLPTALGASIEVHAQVLAARGERLEAIAFLRRQLALFGATSLNERIRKNINLLTLEGKPAPVLASLRSTYGPKGLALIGPTRLYGYAAGGEEAAPAAEKQYIDQVRHRYYTALADMPVPLSAANFLAYGASTTPTLILLDRAGVVRFYHPGAASEAELSVRIQAILRE